MKKIVLLSVILIGFYSVVFAQQNDTGKSKIERLKEFRKKLYTEKLQLTEDESNKFFPIWDEFELKMRQIKKAFRKKWQGKQPSELTPEEADQYLTDALKLQEDELALTKTYSEKLKPIIGSKRVLQLKRVQKEVNKAIINKAKDGRGGRGAGGGHGGGKGAGGGKGGGKGGK